MADKLDKEVKKEIGLYSKEGEEILQMMDKSLEFTRELLAENEKLRYRIVQVQEENKELKEGMDKEKLRAKLESELSKLEAERIRLIKEYERVEEANREYASRYVEVEEENNNLANLYVCSYQLHSTLNLPDVLQIIMEIIINLIGGEEFGIFLLDEKTQLLKPVAMEGIPIENVPSIPLGEGVVGQSVLSGENYYAPDMNNPKLTRGPESPLVCIPLKIKEKAIGAIVLYKLLPQKTQFVNVDYELFTLLAGHAATAIFSAKLYTEAQRKLSTIKGFMELLTH